MKKEFKHKTSEEILKIIDTTLEKLLNNKINTKTAKQILKTCKMYEEQKDNARKEKIEKESPLSNI